MICVGCLMVDEFVWCCFVCCLACLWVCWFIWLLVYCLPVTVVELFALMFVWMNFGFVGISFVLLVWFVEWVIDCGFAF